MTNRQWLIEQMQNMSDEELARAIKGDEVGICQTVASRKCNTSDCLYCKTNWLKSEHKEKPKLTDAERVILENVDEECKYIARDRSRMLYVYSEKPYKSAFDCWIVKGGAEGKCLGAFIHLFQFIKWEDEQAYNIQELLKGE